jgi:hypothetical protein
MKSSAFGIARVLPAELGLNMEDDVLDWEGALEPDALGLWTDDVGGAAEIIIGIERFVWDTLSVKMTW